MDAKRDYQNYTTVLEMVNSVSNDSSVIAFGDQFSALFNAEDRPPRQREYFYFILSDGIRKDVVAFDYGTQYIFMRRIYNKAWISEWVQVATCSCEDMEWKDLPLSSDFINWDETTGNRLQYRKSYDAVYVQGVIKPADPENVAEIMRKQITTLPAGYRPQKGIWYQVCALSAGGYYWRCRILSNGAVSFDGCTTDALSAARNSIEVNLMIPI